MVNSERNMVHAWNWMQNTSIPLRKWRQQLLPMLWPGKYLVLQLIYEKNLFSHSQNEVLKESGEICTDLVFCAWGFLFVWGLCRFFFSFFLNQECKPNSTEITKFATCLFGSHMKSLVFISLYDVRVSTCISGAGFFLYTSFSVIHRRLYIVHGIKSRVCTSQKPSFEGKKPIWAKIYCSKKNPQQTNPQLSSTDKNHSKGKGSLQRN